MWKGAFCIFLRNFAFIPWAYRETTSILKIIWLTLCFGSLTSGWQKVLEEPEGEIWEQKNRQASCGCSSETLYVRSCLRLHRSTCCLWRNPMASALPIKWPSVLELSPHSLPQPSPPLSPPPESPVPVTTTTSPSIKIFSIFSSQGNPCVLSSPVLYT